MRTWFNNKLILVFLLMLLLTACRSNLVGYVNSFERFVERVENNASSYSEEQWEKNDERLQYFIERYDREKQKLSVEEKRKVGELAARYSKARVKSLGINIFGDIWDWSEALKGFADEVLKDIENYQNQ